MKFHLLFAYDDAHCLNVGNGIKTDRLEVVLVLQEQNTLSTIPT